jgi:hypothetical protein
MKRFAVAFALVALMAVAALGLAAGSALASPIFKNASVNIHQSAQLVTGLVPGVNVTVSYSCSAPNPGTLLANVRQNGVSGFSVNQPANCDDQTHQVTVFVPGAFTTGQANALVTVANADISAQAEQFAEITIK